MKKIIVALLLSIINYQLSIAQIGTWHNYLAYHDITEIEKGGKMLYVLASNNLYSYNTTTRVFKPTIRQMFYLTAVLHTSPGVRELKA